MAADNQVNVENKKVAELYASALAEEDGYTLVPSSKASKNKTVKVVEPRVERNGMVVCKRK